VQVVRSSIEIYEERKRERQRLYQSWQQEHKRLDEEYESYCRDLKYQGVQAFRFGGLHPELPELSSEAYVNRAAASSLRCSLRLDAQDRIAPHLSRVSVLASNLVGSVQGRRIWTNRADTALIVPGEVPPADLASALQKALAALEQEQHEDTVRVTSVEAAQEALARQLQDALR
jgi:hypothetical protein